MNVNVTTRAAAVLVAAAIAIACHAQTSQPPPAPAEVVTLSQGASAEQQSFLKRYLFVDVALEEIFGAAKVGDDVPREGIERHLFEAAEELQRGRQPEAKARLRRVLQTPDGETRLLLLAWNTLRGLGERPPPDAARQVQGVVCELHNEAGVGSLAAYRDGRVRFLGGQGRVVLWETPGADAKIESLVRRLLKSSEPLVVKLPASAKRMPGEPPREHFRISVLTYAGIHVVESYGPDMTPEDPAGPALYASSLLVEALNEYTEKHPPSLRPPPPQPLPPGGRRRPAAPEPAPRRY